MNEHLVFYDGPCGFCNRVVRFLIKADHEKHFLFAPLQGETAKDILKNLPPEIKQEDSLILVENFQQSNRKFYILARGVFQIFWLLGGFWSLIGSLSFLPSFLYDWGYRLVARNRQLFKKPSECPILSPEEKNRFLP